MSIDHSMRSPEKDLNLLIVLTIADLILIRRLRTKKILRKDFRFSYRSFFRFFVKEHITNTIQFLFILFLGVMVDDILRDGFV